MKQLVFVMLTTHPPYISLKDALIAEEQKTDAGCRLVIAGGREVSIYRGIPRLSSGCMGFAQSIHPPTAARLTLNPRESSTGLHSNCT